MSKKCKKLASEIANVEGEVKRANYQRNRYYQLSQNAGVNVLKDFKVLMKTKRYKKMTPSQKRLEEEKIKKRHRYNYYQQQFLKWTEQYVKKLDRLKLLQRTKEYLNCGKKPKKRSSLTPLPDFHLPDNPGGGTGNFSRVAWQYADIAREAAKTAHKMLQECETLTSQVMGLLDEVDNLLSEADKAEQAGDDPSPMLAKADAKMQAADKVLEEVHASANEVVDFADKSDEAAKDADNEFQKAESAHDEATLYLENVEQSIADASEQLRNAEQLLDDAGNDTAKIELAEKAIASAREALETTTQQKIEANELIRETYNELGDTDAAALAADAAAEYAADIANTAMSLAATAEQERDARILPDSTTCEFGSAYI